MQPAREAVVAERVLEHRHERLLDATYWKEVVGDAPEEGVDPLILKLFAGVMLLWVLFGPCLTYAVELSGRRRKRLKQD